MKFPLSFAASALVLCAAANAWAQGDSRDFILTPSLTLTQAYNDNIYTEPSSRDGHFITKVAPKITLDTGPSPARVQLSAGAVQHVYAGASANNRLDYNAGVRVRTRISDTASWTAHADYRHHHSNRGDNEANPTADAGSPPAYDLVRAGASLNADLGAFNLKPRLGMMMYDFHDYDRINGARVDQDFRDRDEFTAGLRAGYKAGAAVEVFVDVEANPRLYDDMAPNARTSQGGHYLAGISYAPSKAFKLDVAAGYMTRSYDAGVYKDIGALDAEAALDWSIAQSTRLRASLSRSIVEVTDAGTGGAVRSDMRASLAQTLSETWTGRIAARYMYNDYQGGRGATGGLSDRADHYYEAGAGLEYRLDARTTLTADFTHTTRDSNQDLAEYARNVFMIGVKYDL